MEKIEDNEFWFRFFILFFVFLSVLTICITFYNCHANNLYVKNGYSQKSIQGIQGACWVK
jgi:hypothetical protein